MKPDYSTEESRLRAHLAKRVLTQQVELAWDAAKAVYADTRSMQAALDAGVAAVHGERK